MIRCSYCEGLSDSGRSCQNCAAPLPQIESAASAIFYDPRYIKPEMLTGTLGELIAIQADFNNLHDAMMQLSGTYLVQTGVPQ